MSAVLVGLDHPFARNTPRRRKRNERLCGKLAAVRHAGVDHLDDGAREMIADHQRLRQW
jgi:hypothetical protein